MAPSPRTPKRTPVKPVIDTKKRPEWFRPAPLYARNQPHRTAMVFLRQNVQRLVAMSVGGIEKKSALEVGPGADSIIAGMPFRKGVFVDVSEVLLEKQKQIEKDAGAKNREYIQGRIEDVRLADKFDFSVMNEVLSHVEPRQREAVVRKLARASNQLLITDRFALPFRVDNTTRFYGHPSELVAPMKIANQLVKEGFSARLLFMPEMVEKGTDYFIIYAKRSPKPNIKKVKKFPELLQ